MKATKSNGLIYWIVFSSLCFVIFFTLSGFFRAAENSSSSPLSEGRALSQLKQLHENFKQSEAPEEAKRYLKGFETGLGLANESNEMEKVKVVFNPLVAHLGTKPKETDNRFLLEKKKDLMENLVNAYRKEIPNGDIRVRAAYLNILFDLQASLLNESDEAETVFIKRNHERFGALKVLASTSRDAGQPVRVANLESIFAVYEKAFAALSDWRAKKSEILTSVDKALPSLSKQIRAGDNQAVSDTRRSFLYTAIISLLVMLAAFVTLLMGQKFSRLRYESLSDAVGIVLKEFAQEGNHDQRALTILQSDEDWSKLLNQILETESVFNSNFQALLSVPKSMKIPYLVFSKDKELVHSNDSARRFFEWSEGKVYFDELIRGAEIGVRDGDTSKAIENISKSFSGAKQEVYEVMMNEAGQWVPVELMFFPITNGYLVGGKILLMRLIPNEAARIEKSVTSQVSKIRNYVQKLSKHEAIDIQVSEHDILPIRETVMDLQNLKMSIEERQHLWKSEAAALTDQVTRQKDILVRMTGEISTMNADYAELISLVKTIRGSDEVWHNEVCGIEKDLSKWMENRQRLSSDLIAHSGVLNRAREIETQIRDTASGMKKAIQGFQEEMEQLKNYYQEVKIYSVNLSFTEDPKQKEFAAKARAFASNVGHYTEVMEKIMQGLSGFVNKHPGGSLFPHLDSAEIPPAVMDSLKDEQMRWSNFLQRWKQSSQEILARESQAIDILYEVDKKSNVAMQLGETSIVINDQAKNNLGRWN